MSTVEERPETQDEDERRLAELGYKQELHRAWSGFSNFAISFTIISILAGTFTTYGQAWNNGGPVAISWGWPLISIAILIIAWSMSELVSKYPTAGGIYYWATALGGPAWGWFTGWFNLIGLIGVVASVDYACATFLNATLGLYGVNILGMNFGDGAHLLAETFVLFALIVFVHALINIFQTHLVALLNNVSVFVHVIGVAVIIGILVFVPDTHQSADFVFTERINNSGFGEGMYWFYVLPLGFLLTQYTITGFDASAHVSEETRGAAKAAARGVWQSVFYSAIIGWLVLLAITFAATDVDAVNEGAGSSLAIFGSALDSWAEKAVVVISTLGQLFCGMACVTSASRMTFAFSRDNGLPFSRSLRRVNDKGVPVWAVIFVCVAALVITLPALEGDENAFPYAFFAVVSITVIGLYIAYVIPIYPALEDGRQLRARSVDARQEVQVDERLLGRLGRLHHDHLLPPVHAGRSAVARRVRLEVRELRADHGDRRDRGRRPLVGARGEAQVPRAWRGGAGRGRQGRPGVQDGRRVASGA